MSPWGEDRHKKGYENNEVNNSRVRFWIFPSNNNINNSNKKRKKQGFLCCLGWVCSGLKFLTAFCLVGNLALLWILINFPCTRSVYRLSLGFHCLLIITDDSKAQHKAEKQRAEPRAKRRLLRQYKHMTIDIKHAKWGWSPATVPERWRSSLPPEWSPGLRGLHPPRPPLSRCYSCGCLTTWLTVCWCDTEEKKRKW